MNLPFIKFPVFNTLVITDGLDWEHLWKAKPRAVFFIGRSCFDRRHARVVAMECLCMC